MGELIELLWNALPGLGAAALVAAVVFVAARLLGRRLGWLAGIALPFALGLGFLAGHVVALGWPKIPPPETTHGLAWVALAGLVAGLSTAIPRAPRGLLDALRLAVAALILVIIMGPLFQPGASEPPSLWLLLAINGAIWAAMTSLEAFAERTEMRWGFLLGLVAWMLGAGAVLAASGSLIEGRLGGSAGLALLAALVAGAFVYKIAPAAPARGAACVASAIVAGLVLDGLHYSEEKPASAILLALAPQALWIGRVVPALRRRPWLAGVVGVLGVCALVAAALAVALVKSAEAEPEF